MHIVLYIIALAIPVCLNSIRSKEYFGLNVAQYYRHRNEELINIFKISIALMIIWEVIYWLIVLAIWIFKYTL